MIHPHSLFLPSPLTLPSYSKRKPEDPGFGSDAVAELLVRSEDGFSTIIEALKRQVAGQVAERSLDFFKDGGGKLTVDQIMDRCKTAEPRDEEPEEGKTPLSPTVKIIVDFESTECLLNTKNDFTVPTTAPAPHNDGPVPEDDRSPKNPLLWSMGIYDALPTGTWVYMRVRIASAWFNTASKQWGITLKGMHSSGEKTFIVMNRPVETSSGGGSMAPMDFSRFAGETVWSDEMQGGYSATGTEPIATKRKGGGEEEEESGGGGKKKKKKSIPVE